MARKAEPHKRRKIITAAISVFAQSGYSGARMADVAKMAGIGKGTIYEYFRSKEDLFFATFEHLMEDTGRQLEILAASVSGPAGERLASTAEGLIRMWLPYLELYGLVLEFWSATSASPARERFRAAFKAAYSDLRQTVATLIQEGKTSGDFKSDADPHQLAACLVGAWDALLLQAWLDPEFDPAGASRTHMQVVLNGLAHPSSEKEIR